MMNGELKVTFSLFVLASVMITTGCSDSDETNRIFEDVSLTSGLNDYVGITHGTAWGDYDADGLPDLYVTNHLNQAQLFHNVGNGRFIDTSLQFFKPENLDGDKHGAIWADFDNDGRLDLVQLTGAGRGTGAEPKKLFHNEGDRFEEVAESLGVNNPFGRTRMPLWFDMDNNGLLDLFHGAEARFDTLVPPYFFNQLANGRFTEDTKSIGISGKSAPFCILAEVNQDDHADLVCRVVGPQRTAQIFDLTTLPARELKQLPVTAFEDIAAGDFNNDGTIDLFLARKNPPGTVAFGFSGSNSLIADVRLDTANLAEPKQVGFEFHSTGFIEFRAKSAFPSNLLTAEKIHIGQNGFHPQSLNFSLSKETADVKGTAPFQPGAEAGVYIGFIAPDKWQILVSGSSMKEHRQTYQQFAFKITSTEPITEHSALGAMEQPETAPSRLFMNKDGALLEESDKRGVNDLLVAAVNVVSGDFDNDMDLDLFLLASGDIGKRENLLLLNNGNGEFTVVPNAGGAAGSRVGVGDSVTTVDFDNDGFLDLLAATGGSMGRSLGIPSEDGNYHLYRNVGNKNHWLEVDLEGTSSNRDGIGAIVRVTTQGTTQIRIQDAGVHHRSQNHSRLHFGLGQNANADKIQVQWPSGKTLEINGSQADRILRIKEPVS